MIVTNLSKYDVNSGLFEKDLYKLTQTESVVLNQLSDINGFSYKQIAAHLKISEQTLKNHVSNILRKLNANHRTHAVVIGISKGLVNNSILEPIFRQKLKDIVSNGLGRYAQQLAYRFNSFLGEQPTSIKAIDISKGIVELAPNSNEPVVLDTKYADELGRTGKARLYSYTVCPLCKVPRWILANRAKRNPVCYACSGKRRASKLQDTIKIKNEEEIKWISNEIILLDTKRGKDIGRVKNLYGKYSNIVCPRCHKARWIPKNAAKKNPICKNCANTGGLRGTHALEVSMRKKRTSILNNQMVTMELV